MVERRLPCLRLSASTPALRRVQRGASVCVLFFLLTACGRSRQPVITVVVTASSTPTPVPTATPTLTPSPTHTPTPSQTPAGWETVSDGVQIRRSTVSEGERQGMVYALRLDPARIDVVLRYDPDRPRTIADWFVTERPLAVLNAAFFDPDYTPVGLWVIDDVTYGRGHRAMQGEFRISGAGASIRRIDQRHVTDGTRIIASVESYPLLILPGGNLNSRIGRFRRPEQVAERLVVGIDGAGYLVFVLSPSPTFTLRGLAGWLSRSDFNLDSALNLDGGSSAGMLVRAGSGVWGEDSGRDVPGVLIIQPKVLGVQDTGSP